MALLQEMDAKHNMIDLLAHQFEEVRAGPHIKGLFQLARPKGLTSHKSFGV